MVPSASEGDGAWAIKALGKRGDRRMPHIIMCIGSSRLRQAEVMRSGGNVPAHFRGSPRPATLDSFGEGDDDDQ